MSQSRAKARWPLTPEMLGSWVALYEHSLFTRSARSNIDSFDQWGAELGNLLAQRISAELEREHELGHEARPEQESSTATLLRRYLTLRWATT
jgi:glucose-6-phosphate isomerase